MFDGSREEESKLAKQFWNSVVLIPPVESTLVCKEIKQRTRARTLNDGTGRRAFMSFYQFINVFMFVFLKRDFQPQLLKLNKENH